MFVYHHLFEELCVRALYCGVRGLWKFRRTQCGLSKFPKIHYVWTLFCGVWGFWKNWRSSVCGCGLLIVVYGSVCSVKVGGWLELLVYGVNDFWKFISGEFHSCVGKIFFDTDYPCWDSLALKKTLTFMSLTYWYRARQIFPPWNFTQVSYTDQVSGQVLLKLYHKSRWTPTWNVPNKPR